MSTKTPIIEATSSEIIERKRHLKKVQELLSAKVTDVVKQRNLQKLLVYSNHRFKEFSSKESKEVSNESNLVKCEKCHCNSQMTIGTGRIGKRKKKKRLVELKRGCLFCGLSCPPVVLDKPKTRIQESTESTKKSEPAINIATSSNTSRQTFLPGAQNLQKLMSSRKKLNKDTGLLNFLMRSNTKH